ncbi:WD-40 repeat-containing protein MSI2-like [Apium graveolens]|uniref:WD-40 repeat-containing protein MSI2-like n=1 Tax=Apium graveolens TaxID=4045 RepID=UPI003D7BDB41
MAGSGSEEREEYQVEEEFSVWKKNTPFLYDLIVSHSLEWPSLTVHWLPSVPSTYADDTYAIHKMILGTHTSEDFPNFLLVADAHLPLNPASAVNTNLDHPILPKVEVTQKIHVDGEVNRARCMLQKPFVVAAKTTNADVYVFDCTKQPMDHEGGSCDPDLRLRGHEKEGYGLSWSPFKEGFLLSGSNDCKICMWDISAMPQDKVLNACSVFEDHKSLVNDVSWHSKNESLFGSVGDDCRLMIWDLRATTPQQSVAVHEKEVNYLSFNPYNEYVLATASSDATVGLFDLRKLTVPLHVLSSHTEQVYQVEWDPNHETVLASSSGDRRLMVWDLSRIGDEQLEGEAEDGPPELLFSHGGHKANLSDFSWNKNEPWVISSVAEDNTLQIWQMAESIYREDDDI